MRLKIKSIKNLLCSFAVILSSAVIAKNYFPNVTPEEDAGGKISDLVKIINENDYKNYKPREVLQKDSPRQLELLKKFDYKTDYKIVSIKSIASNISGYGTGNPWEEVFKDPSEIATIARLNAVHCDIEKTLNSNWKTCGGVNTSELKKLRDRRARYKIYDFAIQAEDPIKPGAIINFRVNYYESHVKNGVDVDNKRPLVIVFPTIAGTILEPAIAEYFAESGFDAMIGLISDDVTDAERSVAELDDILIRQTIGVRHIIDYVEKEIQRIDSAKIGVYGASLGGIRAATATAIEPRIAAAAIAVAGANFPFVWSYSKERRVTKYRNERMEKDKMKNQKEFLDEANKAAITDPVMYVTRRSPEDYYMLIADKDTKVMTVDQVELWFAIGKPKYVIINGGHIFGATRLLNEDIRKGIMKFFCDKFDVPIPKDVELNFIDIPEFIIKNK